MSKENMISFNHINTTSRLLNTHNKHLNRRILFKFSQSNINLRRMPLQNHILNISFTQLLAYLLSQFQKLSKNNYLIILFSLLYQINQPINLYIIIVNFKNFWKNFYFWFKFSVESGVNDEFSVVDFFFTEGALGLNLLDEGGVALYAHVVKTFCDNQVAFFCVFHAYRAFVLFFLN